MVGYLHSEREMFLIKEECSLCGGVYPYRSLHRCRRCRRLYCGNCVIFTEDRETVCLNCARKMVTPEGSKSKYAHLSIYLAGRARYRSQVTLPFNQIEEIIGDRLPSSAYNDRYWWSNTWSRSHSEAWLTVGWSVQEVNMNRREVTFQKEEATGVKTPEKKRRRKPLSKEFKALLRKSRPRKRRQPSKSKIAKAQARLKNIERIRSMKEYRGKLKPKGAYEKRLYKPREKPEETP